MNRVCLAISSICVQRGSSIYTILAVRLRASLRASPTDAHFSPKSYLWPSATFTLVRADWRTPPSILGSANLALFSFLFAHSRQLPGWPFTFFSSTVRNLLERSTVFGTVLPDFFQDEFGCFFSYFLSFFLFLSNSLLLFSNSLKFENLYFNISWKNFKLLFF